MGLSTAEFFSLTYPEFEALRLQYQEAERRRDYRFGVLAAVIANGNRSKPTDRVWSPEDFFDLQEEREQSDEEIAAILMGMWGRGAQTQATR